MLISWEQVLIRDRKGLLKCKLCDSSNLTLLVDMTTGNNGHIRLSNYQHRELQVTICWCLRAQVPSFFNSLTIAKGRKHCLGPRKCTVEEDQKNSEISKVIISEETSTALTQCWPQSLIVKILMTKAKVYWTLTVCQKKPPKHAKCLYWLI